MAVIFDVDFEGNDLSEFDATQTDSGDMAASAGSALVGTSYGCGFLIDDTNVMWGRCDFSAPSTDIRLRFYIDPNTITMANNTWFEGVVREGTVFGTVLIYCRLGYTTTLGYRFNCYQRNDAGSTVGAGDYFNCSDAPHYVEIHTKRATSDVASDGEFHWWVDGDLKYSYTNIDNYDNFASTTQLFFGAAQAVPSGASGTFYMDQIKGNNDGSEIGAHVAGNPWYAYAQQ